MGCDIHVRVQRRNGIGWIDVPVVDRYASDENKAAAQYVAPAALEMRNYDVFGILADVRNGVGFAGVDTGDAWPVIAEPRGLPDGLSEESSLDEDMLGHWLGDHSHSWLTLAELEAFPWATTLHRGRGTVSRAVFEQWDGVHEIFPHSGGISGPGIQTVTAAQWRQMSEDQKDDGTRWHIRIEWQETAAEACNGFVNEALPWLRRFGAPADVRIVFGFDS